MEHIESKMKAFQISECLKHIEGAEDGAPLYDGAELGYDDGADDGCMLQVIVGEGLSEGDSVSNTGTLFTTTSPDDPEVTPRGMASANTTSTTPQKMHQTRVCFHNGFVCSFHPFVVCHSHGLGNRI